MAISKDKKEKLVADYIEQLRTSKGFIVADYRGLSVSALQSIRGSLRPIGGTARVVKNRLLLLALKETGMNLPKEWLEGPVLVDFCHGEVPPVAKALIDAARQYEQLQIKGGLVAGSVITAQQVQAIAELPSREVLLAQVLGTINAPASRVSGVIASGIRQVLTVLQAYREKLEGPNSAAAGLSQVAEVA